MALGAGPLPRAAAGDRRQGADAAHARAHDPERLATIQGRLASLHEAKNARYAEWVNASGGALRPGVQRLIDEARSRGLHVAIVTTTSRANVEALLRAAALGPFDAVVCGEDVLEKKPDPEAYEIALRRLALPAEACLAFEDSRNGLLAAHAAGVRTVVTPSFYSAGEDFAGAWLVARDLDHVGDDGPLTIDGLAEIETRTGRKAPSVVT